MSLCRLGEAVRLRALVVTCPVLVAWVATCAWVLRYAVRRTPRGLEVVALLWVESQ